MLGSLIIGADAVRDQTIAQVTASDQLGPMIITAADRERALIAAGLVVPPVAAAAPVVVPDDTLTVREIQQQLRDNPASVREIVLAEGQREEQGLGMRMSVLKLCLASAKAQELDTLATALEETIAAQERG